MPPKTQGCAGSPAARQGQREQSPEAQVAQALGEDTTCLFRKPKKPPSLYRKPKQPPRSNSGCHERKTGALQWDGQSVPGVGTSVV